MKKRAKICLYIFLVLSFIALGILGYFVFNNPNQNVMVGSRKFVTFNSVKNATCYSVEVSNEDKTDTENALYTVDKQQIDGQDNAFKYNVNVEVNNKKVAEESYEQEILNQNNSGGLESVSVKNNSGTYYLVFKVKSGGTFETPLPGLLTPQQQNYIINMMKSLIETNSICC